MTGNTIGEHFGARSLQFTDSFPNTELEPSTLPKESVG